jgi:hypothetical protein
MSITSSEPVRTSLLEDAHKLYRLCGKSFDELLNTYLYRLPEDEYYIFIGPHYLLLGRKATDANGDYWHLDYAAGDGMKIFLKLAPYHLDRVGFHRYLKYLDTELRFLETSKLIKYYGIT